MKNVEIQNKIDKLEAMLEKKLPAEVKAATEKKLAELKSQLAEAEKSTPKPKEEKPSFSYGDIVFLKEDEKTPYKIKSVKRPVGHDLGNLYDLEHTNGKVVKFDVKEADLVKGKIEDWMNFSSVDPKAEKAPKEEKPKAEKKTFKKITLDNLEECRKSLNDIGYRVSKITERKQGEKRPERKVTTVIADNTFKVISGALRREMTEKKVVKIKPEKLKEAGSKLESFLKTLREALGGISDDNSQMVQRFRSQFDELMKEFEEKLKAAKGSDSDKKEEEHEKKPAAENKMKEIVIEKSWHKADSPIAATYKQLELIGNLRNDKNMPEWPFGSTTNAMRSLTKQDASTIIDELKSGNKIVFS